MPLLYEQEVGANSRLAVWKIEEDAEELKWRLQWSSADIKAYQSLSDDLRSQHWLCSRVLLRKMLNTNKFINMQADAFGKPYLKNFPQKFSISHSGDRVAVLLSDHNCGLDLEVIQEKIVRIAPKFISREEWAFLKEDNQAEQMCLIWSAKEAMYKLYGKRKIEFREHLFVDEFNWKPKGKVRGRIEKGDYENELTIHWQTDEKFLIAYAIDEEKPTL